MSEQPTAPMRIGILGASSIALSAVVEPARRRPGTEVVAVAARRPGAADDAAARWGIARATSSYEAVVDDPAVDVVYVSMAAVDHARWSIAALDAGKDVLVEKPAALLAEDAVRMVAAERSDRLLVEAFHDRWHPLFRHLEHLVRNDGFGFVTRMSSSIIGHRPFVTGSVLHDPVVGGGVLRHSGCYGVHWMRVLTGEEPTVLGHDVTLGPLGADATSVLELGFPGGAHGVVTSSFERERVAGDPPDPVVESATTRIEVRGLIVPHHGHSIRVLGEHRARGERPDSGWRTVAGRTTYDHQLDTFAATRGDRAATSASHGDLVAQAVVMEAAEHFGR